MPMQESLGKSTARGILYNQTIPGWLTKRQRTNGGIIVLLGDEPREIPLLDALGFARSRIYNVERYLPIYRRQVSWNLGVSHYHGEVSEYLEYMLHSSQGVVALNLDIEGSYLNSLDSAMTSVLLFCWRNPQTVLATYSNIGRDTRTIWEGIKSLTTFLWLAPVKTLEFLQLFSDRYYQAGYTGNPTRMALRDLFWLRSHLEHSITASAITGVIKPELVAKFELASGMIWDTVKQRKKTPLTFAALVADTKNFLETRAIKKLLPKPDRLKVGIEIADMQHVVYRAVSPWSHRCYFARIGLLETPIGCSEWVNRALGSFMRVPLIYVDRDGTQQDLICDANVPIPDKVRLWDRRDIHLKFEPRIIKTPRLDPKLRGMLKTVRSLQEQVSNGKSKNGERKFKTRKKEEVKMVVSKRKKRDIKMSGESGSNGTTKKRWKKSFMRGEKVTDYGREQLRLLARQGLSTEEIQEQVPNSVPMRTIAATRAIANRLKNKKTAEEA
jgi:hypothetical protein